MLIQGRCSERRGAHLRLIWSTRLSVKLPNPHVSLDQHHVTQIISLHGTRVMQIRTRVSADRDFAVGQRRTLTHVSHSCGRRNDG
jgi:hypothetical protein